VGSWPLAFRAGGGTARRRPLRVLCYGDSLTVGFCANGTLYEPYARTLASALAQATDGAACEVHVCGHSGGTARDMVANLDSLGVVDVGGIVGKGLRRCLDEAPPDLAIIMAGTNDLGTGAMAREVFQELCEMHEVCWRRGVPTLALPPPPAPRLPEGSAFELERRRLLALLATWTSGASGGPATAAFADPGELVPAGQDGCWDPDALHYSPLGSTRLGKALAHKVLSVLAARAGL